MVSVMEFRRGHNPATASTHTIFTEPANPQLSQINKHDILQQHVNLDNETLSSLPLIKLLVQSGVLYEKLYVIRTILWAKNIVQVWREFLHHNYKEH